MRMPFLLWTLLLVLICDPSAAVAQTPVAERPVAVEISMVDQFEQLRALSQLHGQVAVIVFSDRQGSAASRQLGTALHVAFHPAAAGKTGPEARRAPVRPQAGVPPGHPSISVQVVPAAVIGEVPDLVRKLIVTQFRQGEATEPVWLDFEGVFARHFGIQAGVPNLAIFDTHGRVAYTGWGEPTAAQFQSIMEVIENLRQEALVGAPR